MNNLNTAEFSRGWLGALRSVHGFLEAQRRYGHLDDSTVQNLTAALDGMVDSAEECLAAHGSLTTQTKAIEGASS